MLSRIASILAVAMANYDIKATSAFMPPATIQQANTKIVKAPSFALYYHPEQLPPYNSNTNNLMNNEYYDVDLDLDMATQDVSRAYERGVECANNFGMCDIDEVLDLSEELDGYLDCYVGDNPHDCQEEVDDRQDLAEALLVQAEMREDQEQQSFMQVGEGGYRYDTMNGGVGGGGAGAAANANGNASDSLPRASVWRDSNEQFVWGDESSMGV
ncbi:hypothetical protein ACHAWU_002898 [Discostella pseudostelligera]|uniref:Uncharacterized protein n=1 Tax=Discostella pseudostelligera TaxID=259834 RepID=A0ABD3LZ62_9STRA